MRLLVTVLLLVPAASFADHPVNVLGMGAHISCEQFLASVEARKTNTILHFHQGGIQYFDKGSVMMEYANGLLTGINVRRDKDHQIQNDNPSIELWLRNWCTKNPNKNLFNAIDAFAAETPGTPIK